MLVLPKVPTKCKSIAIYSNAFVQGNARLVQEMLMEAEAAVVALALGCAEILGPPLLQLLVCTHAHFSPCVILIDPLH